MNTIELSAERIEVISNMIPIGVEHYIVQRNGRRYLNIRTSDLSLLNRLKAVAL